MYQIDKQGFLINYLDWDKNFALDKLSEINLILDMELMFTDRHWESIAVLRKFYCEFERHPSMRVLIKLLKQAGLVNNTIELHELFGPKDLLRTMSLLAGLPKPPHCI